MMENGRGKLSSAELQTARVEASPVPELVGDPSRQAVPSISGLVYQAWNSIEAWLQLTGDDVIYLEGAEDFDLVRPAQATAVQSKHRKGTVSLGTAEARKALENFWSEASAEPSRRIELRYLTTSAVAKERGISFGGRKGLVAWPLARTDDQLAAELAIYLLRNADPAGGLAAFLSTASVVEVQERLLRRVHWVTSQPGIDLVKQNVLERIALLLQRLGKPIAHAANVQRHLESRFWELVTQTSSSKRRLTLGDLILQVSHATTVQVSVDRLFGTVGEAPVGRLSQTDRPRSPLSAVVAKADAESGSHAVRSWPKTVAGRALVRPELQTLLKLLGAKPSTCTLVVGDAGSGKSALFAELTSRLEQQGMTVFAIKADLLPADVKNLADVSRALGLQGEIDEEIELLCLMEPVVLLIDQLDSVSEVMDRSSQRMSLLLQLVSKLRGDLAVGEVARNVHVVMSSRPFEAEHDARFQSLAAEKISLSLPPFEQVESLLAEVGINASTVPMALREALRRPFALRIFVEIVQRGVVVQDLLASQLLDRWLLSANLGDPNSRGRVIDFLVMLAQDMTDSETLWRPADQYEVRDPAAVRLAESCGVVVRQRGLLGFSHQAWLDDFQARRFIDGRVLAEYAWQRQDGLFARATILRGLQRLRAFDARAYAAALDHFLGNLRTRRHLRHLVGDLIGSQAEPQERELAWVQRLIGEDRLLARRVLSKLVPRWSAWRSTLTPYLPCVMTDEIAHWGAIQLLVAEASFEPEFVERLVLSHWASAAYDAAAFRVFSEAALWLPGVKLRLSEIFGRSEVHPYALAKYAENLGAERAAELLTLYLSTAPENETRRYEGFFNVEACGNAAPVAFVRTLFPWFARTACVSIADHGSIRTRFPSSGNLPLGWDRMHGTGSLFEVLLSCLTSGAKRDPQALWEVLKAFRAIEIDEVQSLIADALSAAGPALVAEATDFLLADKRRFDLGAADVQDEQGVGRLVQGWSTMSLLEAIGPHLSLSQRAKLRDAIEAWDPYSPDAWVKSDARLRRERLRWADEMRLPLLERLPPSVLSARRRRQISEWRSGQPRLKPRRSRLLPSVVGPRISPESMARASTRDLLYLLDEAPSQPEYRRVHEHWLPFSAQETARAFGVFGQAHPERALLLAEQHLLPGRHERAAGELVRILADVSAVNANRLLEAIRSLAARGFASESWRRDAAWAMQALARRQHGLQEMDLTLLESWIVSDAQVIASRVTARKDLESKNQRRSLERRAQEKQEARPRVFHRGLGAGLNILPQGNFPLLSAIEAGLLLRQQPDFAAWLGVLERHVERPEDPAIWTAVLMLRSKALECADRERVHDVFRILWKRLPEAFDDSRLGNVFWVARTVLPIDLHEALIGRWLDSEDESCRQAGGELLAAFHLMAESTSSMDHRLSDILDGPASEARLGAIFTAAAAWGEELSELRSRAHALLMRFASAAKGDEAQAISGAIERRRTTFADNLSKEMLQSVCSSSALLAVCAQSSSFAEALNAFLLFPGMEELVLRAARCIVKQASIEGRGAGGLYGGSLVAVAVSLQRATGTMRSDAMDLYETLLDSGTYGAEEAAEAVLSRRA